MNSSCALAIMARSPHSSHDSIKTRLAASIPSAADRSALYLAFLKDTIATCKGVSDLQLHVAFTPEGGSAGFDSLGIRADELLPQRGDDLGERERHVFEALFAIGYRHVVIIGSDLPTLPAAHLSAAFGELRTGLAIVVLGPSEDGGYYLMGLSAAEATTAVVPDLFTGVRWSTAFALDDTVAAAKRVGLDVRFLPRWYDVDDEAGLARLRTELSDPDRAARAPNTATMLRNLFA